LGAKTNQQRSGENGSRSLGPALQDFPALLKMPGRCETRPADGEPQTVLALFPVISVLLAGVKWQHDYLRRQLINQNPFRGGC